ncbi:hypothetical protein [Chitinimonas sp.]|uniref:hypothetical protein n=1 Tax=Chitinimonas sp. TaxID=1934313 RepID=UPI0035AD90D4
MSQLTYTLLTLLARYRSMDVPTLAQKLGEEERTVRGRLHSLQAQGWVSLEAHRWTITETGRIAAEAETTKRGEALYVRGWRTLRILKGASISELVMLCARPEDGNPTRSLRCYFNYLARVGLVVRAGKTVPARYALLNDPGPLAPQVSLVRREVCEANSRRVLSFDEGSKHV